jgi:myo-inositol 2-dehydrogenase/D-chiro-inositol 1-dehydrogenase
MSAPLNFALIGAGRIGRVHAACVAGNRGARLHSVSDVNEGFARQLADGYGAALMPTDDAIADPAVDAVIIASSTDTHADLIEQCAAAGKAIFCEKPVDLSITRVDECLAAVAKAGVPLGIGFNRRFDTHFAALQERLAAGEIGDPEMVMITSRDPSAPPVEYIRVSGGMFRDMTIHDFDMARWLLGEEPVTVTAVASCIVDPAIGAEGDVDTAVVTLATASGRLASITNSRRAAYGYDQRIEVLGSKGMLRVGNLSPTNVEVSNGDAVSTQKPYYFFLERYALAYRAEINAFIEAVRSGDAPDPGGEDGRKALLIADAAIRSLETGQTVQIG